MELERVVGVSRDGPSVRCGPSEGLPLGDLAARRAAR